MGSSGSTATPKAASGTLSKGDRVLAKYRGRGKWFAGVVSAVLGSGADALYDIAYDDGDKDSGLEAQHVRREDSVGAAAAASSGAGAGVSRAGSSSGILKAVGDTGDGDVGRRSVTFAADVKSPASDGRK